MFDIEVFLACEPVSRTESELVRLLNDYTKHTHVPHLDPDLPNDLQSSWYQLAEEVPDVLDLVLGGIVGGKTVCDDITLHVGRNAIMFTSGLGWRTFLEYGDFRHRYATLTQWVSKFFRARYVLYMPDDTKASDSAFDMLIAGNSFEEIEKVIEESLGLPSRIEEMKESDFNRLATDFHKTVKRPTYFVETCSEMDS